ncbi:zinc-binding alcohol dehydrogenase family protein [Enterococcus sp. MJM12]|uniref:Zinc-type alcohol dehydrogenase-like protein n=1 Tax=Candidatus Enterococcus myersii TaxID=2815322 RepID=A0ABS3H771_9ENTE|nr:MULTISPECIES: zinc-binding alcohol dehydrogenase family protein [Enterococcus]MBO0449300.1 zinc-binding alcohol dehydrogenase family protein [Enterococcus sp. MJM12]MDT2739024.1 zinc-binding alcohol dehydrogenase family protein [Enterococcus canintestini]
MTGKIAAVGFYEGLPLSDPNSFQDIMVPRPQPLANDLLVAVRAVSVNPVDTKLRQNAQKTLTPQILGFDAVGEVVATGANVHDLQVGDRVYYAGTKKRAGSNQALQLVDRRICALAPKTLTEAKAAAMPLTTLTAYELLFEKFGLVAEKNANEGKKILIINSAGGVGSIMSQLAHWAGLSVYGTSSPHNFEWLRYNQVDYPIDYHGDLEQNLQATGTNKFDYIAVLYAITPYFEAVSSLIAPLGHVGTIVEVKEALPLVAWKNLSVSFDWEYMFTKTDFNQEIESQGKILAHVAQLIDEGELHTTLTKTISGGINAKNLKKATALVEKGHMIGKVVVTGPF